MNLADLSWGLTSGGLKWYLVGGEDPKYRMESGYLTQLGPTRLASLRQQLTQVVRDKVPGDVIEAGVWRGGCCIWMRAVLDSLGDTRTVVAADSFAGFPEPDIEKYPGDVRVYAWRKKNHGYAIGLKEVQDCFALYPLVGPVEFVEGPFRDTLWRLKDRIWGLIRMDADSYEATHLSLENLYPRLSQGGFVISDDYGDVYKGLQAKKAVDDYRTLHGITAPLQWADERCIAWRKP